MPLFPAILGFILGIGAIDNICVTLKFVLKALSQCGLQIRPSEGKWVLLESRIPGNRQTALPILRGRRTDNYKPERAFIVTSSSPMGKQLNSFIQGSEWLLKMSSFAEKGQSGGAVLLGGGSKKAQERFR